MLQDLIAKAEVNVGPDIVDVVLLHADLSENLSLSEKFLFSLGKWLEHHSEGLLAKNCETPRQLQNCFTILDRVAPPSRKQATIWQQSLAMHTLHMLITRADELAKAHWFVPAAATTSEKQRKNHAIKLLMQIAKQHILKN